MDFYSQNFKHLEVIVKNNHELWITLNNPEQMNAITLEMVESLTSVLYHADFDSQIRVAIITGAGKAFCAGGDIKAMENKSGMFAGESNELRMRYEHGIQKIPECIEKISLPVIAMVNGAAIGAGCDLAMMCDLRVGNGQSKFAETFSKLGLVPGDGGTFFLQRVVGFSKAMDMFLTAKMISGRAAFDFGLLNYISDNDDQLMEMTASIAHQISSNAPMALKMTKMAMKASYLNDLRTSLNMLSSFQGITQRSHDHFEALSAFKEKRAPQFLGK